MPLECPAKAAITDSKERGQGSKAYSVYIIQCAAIDGKRWICEKRCVQRGTHSVPHAHANIHCDPDYFIWYSVWCLVNRVVIHRYSEFEALRKTLIKDKCEKVKKFDALGEGEGKFPKKKYGGSTKKEVVVERKLGLDRWLGHVLQCYAENLNLQVFLQKTVTKSANAGMEIARPTAKAPEPEPEATEDSLYDEPAATADETFNTEPAPAIVFEATGKEYILGKPRFGSVTSVALASENVLASVGDDKGILLWDLANKNELARIENNRIMQCIEQLSQNTVATGNDDGTVKVWDIDPKADKKWSQRARRLNTLEGHTAPVMGLARMSASTLASCSADNSIIIWETDTANVVTKLEGHEGPVNDVIVIDDKSLASCSADMSIKLWNVDPSEPGGSGVKRSISNCHKSQNVTVLVRINATTIASGGGDMLAKVWDLETATCITSLKGHTSAVQALAVVGESTLVTGSADMTIRFWNIDDAYKQFKAIGGAKHGINYSINGLCAVSGTAFASAADNVKIWTIEDDED
jgi:hypothetical protein